MFYLENQIAAVGCSIAENLTETACQVVQCESEGFVLFDVVGVTANPRVREPQYFISVLTNYSGDYRVAAYDSEGDARKMWEMLDVIRMVLEQMHDVSYRGKPETFPVQLGQE